MSLFQLKYPLKYSVNYFFLICLLTTAQSALGWDHIEKVEKHDSQKDYKTGFGGKFGVQKDNMDKSALGWEHVEKVEKHESQKGDYQTVHDSY